MRPNHPRTNKTTTRIVTGRIMITNVTPRMLSINIYNASRIATSSLAILHVIIIRSHSHPLLQSFQAKKISQPSKKQKNKSALPQLSTPPKKKHTSFPQKDQSPPVSSAVSPAVSPKQSRHRRPPAPRQPSPRCPGSPGAAAPAPFRRPNASGHRRRPWRRCGPRDLGPPRPRRGTLGEPWEMGG